MGRIKAECCPLSFIVVELIFFLYKTGESMLDATTRPYIVRAVCKESFPLNDTCNNLDMYPVIEDYVQSLAGNYLIYYRILVNVPAIILGLFCGTYSDRYGRKIPIMLPSLGSVFGVILYMLSNVRDDLRIPLILAGACLQGIFGKSSVITMAVNSYVSDMTDSADRTQKLGKLLAMNFFGLFAGSLLSGFFQDMFDLNTTFVFIVILHAATVLITIICLKETVSYPVKLHNTEKKSEFLAIFRLSNIKDALNVLFKPRVGRARMIIIILFFVSLINQTCKVGEMDITLLFVTRNPLNWPKSWYGYLLSLDYAVMGLCLFVMLPLLTSMFNLPDSAIILLGVSCKIVRLIWAGFCRDSWMVFSSVAIGAFAGMITSALRSVLSKAVYEDEAGKIFSLLACAETASKLLGVLIFVNLYSATAFFFPGFAYIIIACLYVGLLIPIILLYKDMKEVGSYNFVQVFKEQTYYGTKDQLTATLKGKLPVVDELSEEPSYTAPLPVTTP